MLYVKDAILQALDANLPVFFWGPPGIGKSAIVRQAAESRGWGEESGSFVDVRLSQMEPVDLRGLPVPDAISRKTLWLPPAWLPFEGSGMPPEGVLFLDEASAAPPSVQAAAYQLVLDRQLGETRMMPGWRLVLAGNRVTDGGVSFRLAMPLANRMLHIVQDAPDLAVWTDWAVKEGVSSLVIGFLHFRSALFFTFPDALKAREQAFATPRSWVMVSRLLEFGHEAAGFEALRKLITGAVGVGPGEEFMAWLSLRDKLPDLDALLAGRRVTPPPRDAIDHYFACAVALADRVKKKGAEDGGQKTAQSWSQISIKFLEAADTRYTMLFIELLRHKNVILLAGKEHTDWVLKHDRALE
jgi:MoxR-like ATPase